jgi:hypothetical protein
MVFFAAPSFITRLVCLYDLVFVAVKQKHGHLARQALNARQ